MKSPPSWSIFNKNNCLFILKEVIDFQDKNSQVKINKLAFDTKNNYGKKSDSMMCILMTKLNYNDHAVNSFDTRLQFTIEKEND